MGLKKVTYFKFKSATGYSTNADNLQDLIKQLEYQSAELQSGVEMVQRRVTEKLQSLKDDKADIVEWVKNRKTIQTEIEELKKQLK